MPWRSAGALRSRRYASGALEPALPNRLLVRLQHLDQRQRRAGRLRLAVPRLLEAAAI